MSDAASAVRRSDIGIVGQRCSFELVDDSHAERWDEFVRTRPDATGYHRYAWRNIIRGVFRRETFYLAALASGQAGSAGRAAILGVLPMVRLKSFVVGDLLLSLPYFTYGGVLAVEPAIRDGLVRAACELARCLGVSHLELRHSSNLCPDLPVRTDKVSMVLELPDSPDTLNGLLPGKVRTQIKRPKREGVSVVNGAEELIDEFYTVFSTNMRDLGTPVYPRAFFAAVLREFPTDSRLFVVRHQNVPVAAGLVLGHGANMEIPWASSLRRANALGVNMLLYWTVLEYACSRGYGRFDFGRSTLDSGTFRFKRQWGAKPEQLYWHYWLRDGGSPPVLNHSNPKYHAAVAAWQRLPLFIANRIGPLIARNLP
jgi:FemAB-related protein (PEP-CTERM system-associated)